MEDNCSSAMASSNDDVEVETTSISVDPTGLLVPPSVGVMAESRFTSTSSILNSMWEMVSINIVFPDT